MLSAARDSDCMHVQGMHGGSDVTSVSSNLHGTCQAATETAAGQTQVFTETKILKHECRVGEAVLVHLSAALHALIKVSVTNAICTDR